MPRQVKRRRCQRPVDEHALDIAILSLSLYSAKIFLNLFRKNFLLTERELWISGRPCRQHSLGNGAAFRGILIWTGRKLCFKARDR